MQGGDSKIEIRDEEPSPAQPLKAAQIPLKNTGDALRLEVQDPK